MKSVVRPERAPATTRRRRKQHVRHGQRASRAQTKSSAKSARGVYVSTPLDTSSERARDHRTKPDQRRPHAGRLEAVEAGPYPRSYGLGPVALLVVLGRGDECVVRARGLRLEVRAVRLRALVVAPAADGVPDEGEEDDAAGDGLWVVRDSSGTPDSICVRKEKGGLPRRSSWCRL